jgi:hypothetical protein
MTASANLKVRRFEFVGFWIHDVQECERDAAPVSKRICADGIEVPQNSQRR